MNISEWVLEHYGQESYTPGLERINKALFTLKDSLQQCKVVIIAGTNGKGETTHRLKNYFSTDSFCAWTSPHIEKINERFSSESGDIDQETLEGLVLFAHEKVQEHGFELTFYEFLFYVFCLWAERKRPSYLFLEVGLGGRLDAVNALDADQVILTSISRDHQEFLGNRFDLILREKLGVLRPNSTLITFLDSKYLQERTAKYVESVGAQWIDLARVFKNKVHFSECNQYLAYASSCLLRGVEMDKNFAPVGGLLPHRGEIVRSKNVYQIFGSHNLDGIRKLIQFLEAGNYTLEGVKFDFVIISFSRRNSLDVTHMLGALKTMPDIKIIVTSFEHPKAYDKEDLINLTQVQGLEFVSDIKTFLETQRDKRILVTGSYYFISSILRQLRHK